MSNSAADAGRIARRIRDLLDQASELRHFVNERAFAYGSLFGECGLLISLATINLAMGRAYFDAGRARDVERTHGWNTCAIWCSSPWQTRLVASPMMRQASVLPVWAAR